MPNNTSSYTKNKNFWRNRFYIYIIVNALINHTNIAKQALA